MLAQASLTEFDHLGGRVTAASNAHRSLVEEQMIKQIWETGHLPDASARESGRRWQPPSRRGCADVALLMAAKNAVLAPNSGTTRMAQKK